MLPITRATADNFCRLCLQLLDKTQNATKPYYDLQNHPILLQCFYAIAGTMPKSSISPSSQLLMCCYSCFSKISLLHRFGETVICISYALKEMIEEYNELKEQETLEKFMKICVTCFRNMPSLDISDGVLDLRTSSDLQEFLNNFKGPHEGNVHKHFPTHICKTCHPKIRTFLEFWQLGRESYQYIENVVHKTNSNFETDMNVEQAEKLPEVNIPYTNTKQSIVAIKPELVLVEDAAEQNQEVDEQYGNNYYTFQAKEEKTFENKPDNIIDDPVNLNSKLNEVKAYDSSRSASRASADPFEPSDDSDSSDSDYTYKEKFQLAFELSISNTKQSADLKCEKCNQLFQCRSSFEKHFCKEFCCSKCPKTFKTKIGFTRHINKAHTDSLWHCEICVKDYKSSTTLRNHIRRIHSGTLAKCGYCQKEFKQQNHLKEHIKIVHQGIRPYKCQYCQHSFGLSKTRRIHEMIHTGERPFKCKICEKQFRQVSELKLHLLIHSTDLKFRCSVCKQMKATKEELDEHKRIHMHQCTKCGRMFTKLCHLNAHNDAVHLKLRPFKCSYCEKSFAERKTMQLHEATHTGAYTHSCSICNKKFRAQYIYQRHMRTHNLPPVIQPKIEKD